MWKNTYNSERINSFNIYEALENHNQRQVKKIGKWRFFFSPFPLYHGALRSLPVVSPVPTGKDVFLKQTRTYHVESDVLLHPDVVAFILLIYSGKTPGSEIYSWRYFNTVRIQTMAVGVSDRLRYAHVREVVSRLLATPERVAQFLVFRRTPSSAPQLLKQQLFQQVLGQQRVLTQNICLKGWGLPGQAQATLNTSHEVAAKGVLGRVFCSPESEKLMFSRFLLPALWPCVPMHK